MRWTTRPARPDDVPSIVRLVDRVRQVSCLPFETADLFPDVASPTSVVTCVGDEVVGALVARPEGDVGRILAIVIHPDWRRQGVGSSLLECAEIELVKTGARRLTALLADGQIGTEALANRGFTATTGLSLYQKDEALRPTAMSILERWDGELVAPSRWERYSGLRTQRDLVDERVLAPLMEPELAGRFGVEAPTTMMLFGPPGTGKTSFAKAVAGRLGWPFVELLPSKLGANGAATMADELHRAFRELLELDHVVIFIDEIDDIASSRAQRPDTQAVVNELLKAIMRVRESPGRLLIGATNSIGALDSAVVRPGRFDLVIPIGPPDAEARHAIIAHLLGPIPECDVDPSDLVEATEGMTPADIAGGVQRAAAEAFRAARHGSAGTITSGLLRDAFATTALTISPADRVAFEDESARFSRW